jgi:hypothetical protein
MEVVILQVFNPPIVNLPKNDQPYSPYGPLLPYQNVRAVNFNTSIDSPVMDSGVEKIR